MLVPGAVIGSLSVMLAVGLSALRIIERLDDLIAARFLQKGASAFPQSLPESLVWLAALVLAFALSYAVLSVAGTWRRVVLWVSTAVLVAVWAPVLSLAAHAPDVAAPLIVVIWSGVCSIVYARNHRMPCDEASHPPQP